MVVLLSICLWYVSIVATCIAVHFAVCHALYNNKTKKIGKNRCLVFLNDLVLFCIVILSVYVEQRARVGRPQTSSSPPVILLLAVPRRLFCFGSLVVLDVVFRYLSLC